LPKKNKVEKDSNKNNPIAVWSPDDYAREMDRVFSDFERRMEKSFPGSLGGGLTFPRWRSFELPEVRRPFADLIDAGTEYRARVEVPGIPKEKLNISVTPKEIKIEGEAESNFDEKKEGFVRRERTYSKVKREMAFPEDVIAEKAEATVKDGILEVRVPKKVPSETKTHRVQVK